jgi:hypothetical protein
MLVLLLLLLVVVVVYVAVVYPIPVDPPLVPQDDNPTGCYRHGFDVEDFEPVNRWECISWGGGAERRGSLACRTRTHLLRQWVFMSIYTQLSSFIHAEEGVGLGGAVMAARD